MKRILILAILLLATPAWGLDLSEIYPPATRSKTVTDDYEVTRSDFGSTIRMDAATDKTVTLLEATTKDDGKRLTVVRVGDGDVTIACPAGYYIAGASLTTIKSTEVYSAITIEYVHADTMWIDVGSGSWTGAE